MAAGIGLVMAIGLAPASTAASSVAPRSSGGVPSPAAVEDCSDGFRDTAVLPRGSRIQGLVAPARGTVGVGWHLGSGEPAGRPRILTAIRDADGWRVTSELTPDGEHGVLRAVATSAGGTVWAAGATFESLEVQRPLVVRRDGSTWVDASPAGLRGVATGIAGDAAGRVWVTTTEVRSGRIAPGIHVLVAGQWRREALPRVGGTVRLAAIAAPDRHTTAAVGSVVSLSGVRPLILVRKAGTWVRERPEPGLGWVVLSAVTVQADGGLTASGWRTADGRTEPLTLRRGADGTWRVQPHGSATGVAGIILAAGRLAAGPIGAGASYLATAGQWVPAVARPGEAGWQVAARAGIVLQAVAGDPTASGWVAAASTYKGLVQDAWLTRLCDLAPVTDPGARRRIARLARAQLAREQRRAERRAAADAKAAREAIARRARSSAHPAGVSAPGALTGRIGLRDIAADLGLPVRSSSYGITTGDVDGDGRPDLVWSRHGGPLAVYLRTDDGFQAAIGTFARADRHTCVATPLDAGPIADIACVTGGQHGLGISSTELYLQPLDPATRDSGTEAGLTDPVMRGRSLVALDADGDGAIDLYLAGEERLDGLPAVNRLVRNDGDGTFTVDLASGLTSSFGLAIPVAADLDLDGRTDLLVAQHVDAFTDEPIHLYRNDGGTFRDIPGASGLRSIGETDLLVAQLDGGGRPEIVQLAEDRLVVSRWSGDRYTRITSRAVPDGQRVAAGDIDGDGDLDLYVACGSPDGPRADLVLRNRGDGSAWQVKTVPDTSAGMPDDVLGADLDGDGRAEFALVSGRNRAGPFQVIDAIEAADG